MIPAPLSVISCSTQLPSVEAKSLWNRKKFIEPRATFTWACFRMIPSAARSKASLSSRETLNGSWTTRVRYFPLTGFSRDRTTFFPGTRALARAMDTASLTTFPTAAFSSLELEANPQAPETITLTPNPLPRDEVAPSTCPFLVSRLSMRCSTTRTSP